VSNQGLRAPEALSFAEIERRMARVRAVLAPNTAITAQLPCCKIIDELSLHWMGFPDGEKIYLDFEVFDAEGQEDAEGRSYYSPSENRLIVGLSGRCYARLLRGNGRSRFTLCHEITHVVLHSMMLIRRALMPEDQLAAMNRPSQEHKRFEDSEWQANGGGGALLMPAKAIEVVAGNLEGDAAVDAVMQQFGVTHSAAAARVGIFTRHRPKLMAV
jgi:hypothetical protein